VEDKKHATHSVQLFGKVAHSFSLANRQSGFMLSLLSSSIFLTSLFPGWQNMSILKTNYFKTQISKKPTFIDRKAT